MKKYLAIIVLSCFSSWVFSEPMEVAEPEKIAQQVQKLERLNQHLMALEDESAFNILLVEKAFQIENLLSQLRLVKQQALPELVDKQRDQFLQSRIKINQEKKNDKAVLRDKAELAVENTRRQIGEYLQFLHESSKNYVAEQEIIAKSESLLQKSRQQGEDLRVPENIVQGRLYEEFKHNHQVFSQVNATYQDILLHVIQHPQHISSRHWFQEITLINIIDRINDVEIFQPINRKLNPLKVDVGGVTISAAIIILVYFSFPWVFKFTSWFIPKYLLDANKENHTQVYLEVRKPARGLLIFYGIDLATYALFYRTDYRASIEVFTYIVYSLLFVWLFFKIMDTAVLLRVQEISRVNKELRRELINLGVQVGKTFIIVIILAIGLNHFGISITAIMSTLGIGGLAFALAAKDSLSNLFGGVTILFDNLYRMGDWVMIGDVEGTVAEIGLRSTTIRTFDNALITIPNAQVSVSSVKNWNRRIVGRRIKLHVGVTYESEMKNIRQALADIREMLKTHPDIANPKEKHYLGTRHFKLSSLEDVRGVKATQLVYMDRYSDFSIDILVYCFSKTVRWEEWLAVKEDVLFKIADILKHNNLEFAYPTQVRINRLEPPGHSEEISV